MYVDDDFAREIIIDIMDIGGEDEMQCNESMRNALDDHIREQGMDTLFVQLVKLYGPLSRLK